ncbi:hypothetical protein [Streptomyces sp. NPDC059262]|uniref:hypothetical protein n=1 Tax=Streptomyces sp. NPDC059262 TaxID=3346797 RepID=UPI0036C72FE5
MVNVKEYIRADGTRGRVHSRWAAGARREMSVLATVALVVVGFAHATGSGGADGSGEKAPRPSAVYPVKFLDWDRPRPRLTPTVSYPIPWDRSH